MNAPHTALAKRLPAIALWLLLYGLTLLLGIGVGARLNDLSYRQRLNLLATHNAAYRWYALRVAARSVAHAATAAVECPADGKAIALLGQSNAANRIDRAAGLKAFTDGRTFMWDWSTGRCYHYAEPVAGTDGVDAGNIITAVIEDFRRTDARTPLIVVAFARGGSSVFSWSHGFDSIRLDAVLERLRQQRIAPVLFLWHQGETEAVDEEYVPDKAAAYGMAVGSRGDFYRSALDIILGKIHAAFPGALAGVAVASICGNAGNAEVRAAQRAAAARYSWTALSSDTDAYGAAYRQENCHFNERGEQAIAADYLKLLDRAVRGTP